MGDTPRSNHEAVREPELVGINGAEAAGAGQSTAPGGLNDQGSIKPAGFFRSLEVVHRIRCILKPAELTWFEKVCAGYCSGRVDQEFATCAIEILITHEFDLRSEFYEVISAGFRSGESESTSEVNRVQMLLQGDPPALNHLIPKVTERGDSMGSISEADGAVQSTAPGGLNDQGSIKPAGFFRSLEVVHRIRGILTPAELTWFDNVCAEYCSGGVDQEFATCAIEILITHELTSGASFTNSFELFESGSLIPSF